MYSANPPPSGGAMFWHATNWPCRQYQQGAPLAYDLHRDALSHAPGVDAVADLYDLTRHLVSGGHFVGGVLVHVHLKVGATYTGGPYPNHHISRACLRSGMVVQLHLAPAIEKSGCHGRHLWPPLVG